MGSGAVEATLAETAAWGTLEAESSSARAAVLAATLRASDRSILFPHSAAGTANSAAQESFPSAKAPDESWRYANKKPWRGRLVQTDSYLESPTPSRARSASSAACLPPPPSWPLRVGMPRAPESLLVH